MRLRPKYCFEYYYKWTCTLLAAFCFFGQIGLGITAALFALLLWFGEY